MILLSSIIETFESEFLERYQSLLLPSHRQALAAMKHCRTSHSPVMLAQCDDCESQRYVPHSCGHRSCPHCQQHESQQWLERQLQKQVPAEYFLVTFTLPNELRALAWQQQRTLYDLLIRCSWETVKAFTQNDPQLQGNAGAITVLHTHSRRLDYHPHVHLVIPAAAIDPNKRLWRTKKGQDQHRTGYLFNHKALAKVFRAKLLEAIAQAGLALPDRYDPQGGGECRNRRERVSVPKKWVVDVKSVGRGDQALVYLGRYLYNHREVVYAGFAGAKTCQRRHSGKGYYRLPGRPGDFPLPGQQNPAEAHPNPARRPVSVADPSACLAQGLSAGPQFRLFTPQQQTPDPPAASPARCESEPGPGLASSAGAAAVTCALSKRRCRLPP